MYALRQRLGWIHPICIGATSVMTLVLLQVTNASPMAIHLELWLVPGKPNILESKPY